jgi:hypothetical protein
VIKVNFVIVILAIPAVFLVYGLIQAFYYLGKYSHPDSDEERVRGFIYHFLPELHYGTNEDFYYMLRVGLMIIFVLAVLYALLFKMPIPFVWKPLLVAVS